MKKPLCLITRILAPLLLMLCIRASFAGNATWDLNPGSGDWNTATNWTPATVPNGSAHTATFGLSNTTDISISANTEVKGIMFTPGASAYTVTVNPNLTLTVSGTGITGPAQLFLTTESGGTIVFSHSATAGSNTFWTVGTGGPSDGQLVFKGTSTAGSAIVGNSSEGTNATFLNRSTAGNADITEVSSGIFFSGRATAAHATISLEFAAGGSFSGSSTAGSAHIGVSDNSSLSFNNNSSAGNAFIGNDGQLEFYGSSTAGSALIISTGSLYFFNSSRGGTAQIELRNQSDITLTGPPAFYIVEPNLTIGSLAGNEGSPVFLGGNNLTVGSNNMSTTFSGVIQDGGDFGGMHGSLTKIRSGTFDLTGANTYTGNTNVNGGVLKVDGSITSNTFVNQHGTLAGTGMVDGNVTNAGVVSPGDAPGTLTVNSYTEASNGTLLIDIAGPSTGEFSVLDILGNADLDGILHPVFLNSFIPTIGESFTFLDYTFLTGEFSRIQNQVFDNDMERWVVTYQATNAILTATKNVPDHSSTLLLLTLSLLGLMTYRHGLLCKQA